MHCINPWALCFEAVASTKPLLNQSSSSWGAGWAPGLLLFFRVCRLHSKVTLFQNILKIVSIFCYLFLLFFSSSLDKIDWFCPATGNVFFLLQNHAGGRSHSLYLGAWGKHGMKDTRHLKKKTQQKQLPQREQDKSFPLWIWAISV